MQKVFIFFLQIIPLLLSAQEVRQNITPQFYETHIYTTKDGLSQVSINDIVQDDEGFLWIATQSGLNRFDGTSFYAFDNADYGEENCGNYINVLVPDKNRIWIGTRAAGLCYFDKKAHRFYDVKALQNFNIEDAVMDSLSHLFVTLENKGIGALKRNAAGNGFQTELIPYFKDKNITATSLFISKSGMLWVGTKEGRLFYGKIKRDPGEIIFSEFSLPVGLDKIFVINSHLKNEIWVGTQNKLFRIDLLKQQLRQVEFQNTENNSSVFYELKWQGDILWIGTGAGLLEYDTKKQKLINRYVHSGQDVTSLSNNVIYTIYPDQYGQIWVGTGKYLDLFYKDNIFNKIQRRPDIDGFLNSNIVFSIFKNSGDLWVGTSGGGINLIRERKTYTFTKGSHNFPSNICFSLMADENNVWAGTREGLVIIKNSNGRFKNMQVENLFYDPSNTSSLSSNFVRFIYKDSQNHIWVCTSGGGLNLFTGDISKGNITFKHFRYQHGEANSIASDQVNYIIEAGKNQYWIATDKGLNIMTFDNRSGYASFSRLRLNDSLFVDKDVIYTLLKDRDNGIWIGTTGGLYYLQDQHLVFYNVKKGLPDNIIYGILEDFQGNIWVSTNKGLSRFNKRTKTFTNYHQSDGLSSEEYDLHAKFIDNDGVLYFGGIDGITYFNPEKLKNNQPDSKLYIDNIQITDAGNNSIETLLTENNRKISIREAQFPVTINFSDINLRYYKNATFAYRLMPQNTRWSTIKDKRFIQLLSLSPGDYTMEIQAAGKNGISANDKMLHIPITVIPHWSQSKLAYFIYILGIIIILYWIFRFSLKRKIEHQENLRLKEVNNLKSQLYTNITHEFRTPLTVIRGMTDEMRATLSSSEQKHYDDKLEMIERNSDKLLHLVKQMLDMSKIEEGKMKVDLIQDNIVSYLQYVLESFQSMADAKKIKLVFYHETGKVVMDYDQDKVFIIASNLLSNAIKFTPVGGKVIFHVKREEKPEGNYFIMKVHDSGIGIEEQYLQHIFDRFYQVDNTSTRIGEGTGIGLALTKELVEMLNGEITVKSNPGKGTEFCVSLPVTNKAPVRKSKPLKTQPSVEQINTVDKVTEDDNDDGLPLALVVEDNLDVAKYIMSCLTGKYRVKWSPDGKQGIEAAILTIPDIIISDVMMPEKDGFEVCEILKTDERTSHIPIILLTAKATDKDRIEGLSHGADAYLTKPFNKEELFVRLEQLIKIRRQLQEKYSKVEISLSQIPEPAGEERFLKKAIEAIEKHLDNPDLDPVLLAESLNLSESQLYRKLKALNGKSTGVFIRSIRLSAAKEFLTAKSMNISQVAYRCGFSNPAWFSRAFKDEFGISPSKYKK